MRVTKAQLADYDFMYTHRDAIAKGDFEQVD
jgi:hypothetical protein